MSYPFDATLKEILGQTPADLREPFGLPALEPAVMLNVDLSTISAATDVAIGFGEPVAEIADLNFQSGPDPTVAARLLLYNAAFHLRFAVPVRSIVELYLEGGLGLLPLAPLCKMPAKTALPEALRTVVREIDRRLAAEPDHAKAVRLMTAAFILTGLRVPKETLPDLYQGVRIMHQTSAYDALVEEGRISQCQENLLELGRQRFGNPDQKTEAALTAIADLDRLVRMMNVILNVKSWKALLAVK